jgi:uncharacterized protein (TIGR02147 family)
MNESPFTVTDLRELAAGLGVARYLSHRDFLRDLYKAAKGRSPDYSYLRFAEDLGFSRTNVLRLVIVGARPLTVKAATKIGKALALGSAERRYFTTLVAYGLERVPAERDALFRALMEVKTRAEPSALAPELQEYFADWYHPVIREMAALDGFSDDAEWIKRRLSFPLRVDEIKRSLALLKKLKLLVLDTATGRWIRGEGKVATASEVDSTSLVRFHQAMISMGREAITAVEEAERDVRAITVCVPEELIPVLKGKLEEWIYEVLALEEGAAAGGKRGDRVVQVNMQMFPFTKGGASR